VAREKASQGSGAIFFCVGRVGSGFQRAGSSAAVNLGVNLAAKPGAALLTILLPQLVYGRSTPCQDAQRGGNSPRSHTRPEAGWPGEPQYPQTGISAPAPAGAESVPP